MIFKVSSNPYHSMILWSHHTPAAPGLCWAVSLSLWQSTHTVVAGMDGTRAQEHHLRSDRSVNSIMKCDTNFICKIYAKAIRAKVLIARATFA